MKKGLVVLTVLLPLLGLILFLRMVTGTIQAKPQLVEVGGTLTGDTVWTAVNSPYILTTTLTIPAGITLTVEPGVTVLGQSYGGIVVEGKIVAIGTPASPITFTSAADSAPGEWPGFFFWDGAGHFEHVAIRYGGEKILDPWDGSPRSGANINVPYVSPDPNKSTLVFRDVQIQGSNGFSMFLPTNLLNQIELDNVTFTENITDRIQIVTSVFLPITTSVMLSAQPGLEGYDFEGGIVIDAGNLTLEPGVTLFCRPEAGIVMQGGGHLTAVGTPQKPITFTTATDTAVGRWGGIFFWDGSAELVHTRIRFAGADVGQQAVSALHVYEVPDGRKAILENSVIEGSGGYAVAVEVDNLHQLHLQNNQFVDNALNRILLLPDIDGGNGSLAGSASLPGQDGLQSYELLPPGLVVPTGMTLTVGAGATVMTPDTGEYLDVQGHLEAVGTAVNPILFTSIDDLPANNWSGIAVSGSANFEHVTIRHAYTALFISSSSAGVVSLTNSTLEENLVYPIKVTTNALHRLMMDNVTFSNNLPNRVGIETSGENLTLAGSPILSPQPGLEGYEELNTDIPTTFSVPEGITLTLQPGTNLMMLSTVQVAGHVDSSGTVAESVIWQAVPGSDGGAFSVVVLPTGTAVFNHTTLKGSPTLGIAIVGESDEPVLIENSTLEAIGDVPVLIEPPSLHRVQLNNVAFLNNALNRVLVETSGGWDAIAADVTLTAQPGLEWYEFADASVPQTPPAQFVVPNGITLTVKPGVELRFGDGAEEFVVNGRLHAIGTPTSPITFTSAIDSAPGEWIGITVENGNAYFDYAEVRYGENNIVMDNTTVTNSVNLQNSQIHSAGVDGLRVLNGTVTAVCSSFNNNGNSGVLVRNTGNLVVEISSSTFVDNVNAGLQNDNAVQVDARQNWWGDASGPAGIGPGSGDAVLGNVLFDPWLQEDTCTTVTYQLYLPAVVKP